VEAGRRGGVGGEAGKRQWERWRKWKRRWKWKRAAEVEAAWQRSGSAVGAADEAARWQDGQRAPRDVLVGQRPRTRGWTVGGWAVQEQGRDLRRRSRARSGARAAPGRHRKPEAAWANLRDRRAASSLQRKLSLSDGNISASAGSRDHLHDGTDTARQQRRSPAFTSTRGELTRAPTRHVGVRTVRP